jgi:hypothetical protein
MAANTRAKAIGLLLLAVLLGGAAGSALTALVLEGRHGGPPRRGSGWYMELLEKELHLTAAQKDSVAAVLERHSAPMEAIWADMNARIDTVRAAIRADIRAHLTAEQQARYAEVTAQLDADRRRRNSTKKDR